MSDLLLKNCEGWLYYINEIPGVKYEGIFFIIIGLNFDVNLAGGFTTICIFNLLRERRNFGLFFPIEFKELLIKLSCILNLYTLMIVNEFSYNNFKT